MSVSVSLNVQLSPFAADVAEGLSSPVKRLSPRYFYDDLGSALFEAITLLPEYGLTRADERVLRRHACELGCILQSVSLVGELGSGSGRKTSSILQSLKARNPGLRYSPIDVSAAALDACRLQLSDLAEVSPICSDWLDGVEQIAARRASDKPLLLLFLGSSIGNLDRASIAKFLSQLHALLRAGDYFLLGADLVKDVDKMIAAYDDSTGVTAAFNKNLLTRINRELSGHFDLRAFDHHVRWDAFNRRIEMHLLAWKQQDVYIGAIGRRFHFDAGETIWTESSHKFTELELESLARASGFTPEKTWTDLEWPLAETLWRA